MRRLELTAELTKTISALHGIIGVRKPGGQSSAQTVENVKKTIISSLKADGMDKWELKELNRRIKVGHGGTLDPIATGVLVIGIGDGCKQMQAFLHDVQKSYRATARLGQEFDTYDRTGLCIVERPFSHITGEGLEKALQEKFTGKIMQRPPTFSALHINGRRAYDIARKRQKQMQQNQAAKRTKTGQEMEETIEPELKLPEREVTISRLKLVAFDSPEFVIELDCSSGTYVRSLIHDIGGALNSAAAMYGLERTAQGPITLEDCVDVEALQDLGLLEVLLKKNSK